jgi:tRNA-2-methylthio-N6-dimethylallyladenosine synthase
MRKLYIQTHGCQMNEYDSAKMFAVLHQSHQLIKTDDPAAADVLLLNSCSIREKAQEKVFSDLGRWRRFKEKNKQIIIGVGGCVASQEGELLLKRAPFVDLVFGPQTIHRLGEMLNEVLAQKNAATKQNKVIDISFTAIEKFDCLPEPCVIGPTASISIMEGCSKYCSFCIVPYVRGAEVSRSVDSVLTEAASLAQQGVKELTLLGQNVNDYCGLTHEGKYADLAFLLPYIAALPGISRLRFITSHPGSFSTRLINVFATVPSLTNHLHLPLQSGSDRILTAMKRGYTALEYKAKIRKLRQLRPDICISSDFIVGFPGESTADFDDTMKLISEIGFDHSFSFIYSPRPGTPATRLADTVPVNIKQQRLQLLQATIDQQGRAISEAMIGSQQTILVIDRAKLQQDEMIGRTTNNRLVRFKAKNATLIGQMLPVKITAVSRNSLLGELSDA